MASPGYREALDFLFPRTTTIKFGLDTTRRLLSSLGHPESVYPAIHVGGTNGKGSTAALIAEALQADGWRVGLYTSPHLVSFRERIRVDGIPVSPDAVAVWTATLRPEIEATQATFFEATTAIAFADFAARGVDLAVVEVGLGGRLDSTNVIQPVAAAITKIEMDHQKYLGDTIAQIAREKAWIAKPGAPLVVGETNPDVLAVIRREARAAVRAADPGGRADVRVLPGEYVWDGPLGLAGPHQRRNAAVAYGTLMALPERYRPSRAAVETGFGRARVEGRLDRRGKWLFDVAHNPDGVAALVTALRALSPRPPVHALVSILGDKEWPEMLVALDQAIDRGVLTIAPSALGRRWDLGWLREWLARPDRTPARAAWTLVEDFSEAMAAAQLGAGTILVTGSFHTVGDVMDALGLSALRDGG